MLANDGIGGVNIKVGDRRGENWEFKILLIFNINTLKYYKNTEW